MSLKYAVEEISDNHYVLPRVGCVVVTDSTIIPAGSGYDISCGVLYMKVPGLSADDVGDWDRRAAWIREIETRVATGVGSKRPALARPIFVSKRPIRSSATAPRRLA